ncbi:MAG TPA: PAS domain-containing protein, partial [Thermoplasmata archaeon]|nr:PAS domain-containing protein [Thermoplasmata archaeon]
MIGELSKEILGALVETIPLEFSVVDADDNVVAWNKHDTRIFRRPENVIGMNVRDCHPKKSVDSVVRILAEMKEGKRDKARFWIDIGGAGNEQKVMIEYYAL